MDQELYSLSLEPFKGEISNSALKDSLNLIFESLASEHLKLLIWDNNNIALSLNVPVDLPPLGNFDGLDIKESEPVLIVFNIIEYPTTPPIVFTDRNDFPKDRLAHLYIAKNGRPPAFCLVKGSMADWYANKRSVDLVARTSNWLRDAVTGELSENGDQFDPLRLEGYSGSIIYDYNIFYDVIKNNDFLFGNKYTIAIFERKENSFVFKTFLKSDNVKENLELLESAFKKEEENLPTPHYHIGYIVSSETKDSFSNYIIESPTTLSQLEEYCSNFEVDLTKLKSFIASYDMSHFRGIPVIVAIKRPKNVIGYDGDIEFSNFVLIIGSEHKTENFLDPTLSVYLSSHNQPLTLKKAKQISGNDAHFEGLNIVFGCGALGSKIVMHLGRSGQTNFFLCDPDTLSPHNMVRHALLSTDVGKSKVKALKLAIDELYRLEESKIDIISTIKNPALRSEIFKAANWIFDFTASESFFNTLINAGKLVGSKIVKGSISDFGALGIMLIEGKDRIVRLDDMILTLYHRSASVSWISEWLKREYKANQSSSVLVSVGVGCNSQTTILSDDKISIHAAYFTGVIKKESLQQNFIGGKIYLNRIIEDDEYRICSEIIPVLPFKVFTAINNSSWEIRFSSLIMGILDEKLKTAAPKETGGVFIGSINYKTKTIHVLDIINAPTDSDANEVCFHRGIEGLSENVEIFNSQSGGQIGYIGEWHSHPNGPSGLSKKDLSTVKEFQKVLSSLTTPLPVFLTVVTPGQILPYVY